MRISDWSSDVCSSDRLVRVAGAPVAVMQCATRYPCPPEEIGLNILPLFRERYGSAVGLSDHSATIFPGLAAATLGIEVLEVHVTLSRDMFGPDVIASPTPAEFAQLCAGVRFVDRMKAGPGDKDDLHASPAELRAETGR